MRLFRAFPALRRFQHDDHGSMAVVFAAVFGMLIFALGMAIDLSRLVIARQILQQSADSAALAAAGQVRQVGYTPGDNQAPLLVMDNIPDNFESAMLVSSLGAMTMNFEVDSSYMGTTGGWLITLSATGSFDAGLTRIFGFHSLDVNVNSEVFLPEDATQWASLNS